MLVVGTICFVVVVVVVVVVFGRGQKVVFSHYNFQDYLLNLILLVYIISLL